jgi:hypothetical protein
MPHTHTIRHTVKPGQHTEIGIIVAPHVVCRLHKDGSTEKDPSMLLFSDAEGIVRVFVQPSEKMDEVIVMALEYEADGHLVKYIIELRVDEEPTDDMPFPGVTHSKKQVHENARVRPALSAKEMLEFTQEELLERGYPVRPSPGEAEDAFNAWRTAVSAPTAIVSSHTISHPYLSCGPGVLTGWAGYELQVQPPPPGPPAPPTAAYDWINASWFVPRVSERETEHDYSAIWVGIDIGSPALVQAGTEQDCMNVAMRRGVVAFYTYYAWTEFLPLQSSQCVVPGVAVHPRDQIYVQVWMAKSIKDKRPYLPGKVCFFQIENLTTHQSATVHNATGGVHVTGYEAEWIVERPYVTTAGVTALSNLARFTTFKVFSAYAHDSVSGAYVGYNGARNSQITMEVVTLLPPPTILATVTPVNTSTMEFQWHNYS